MARRPNRRVRRIWFSVLATGGGLLLLTLAVLILDRARDTDLRDGSGDVTTSFLHDRPTEAPDLWFADIAGPRNIDAIHGPGPRRRTLPEDTGSGLAWGDYDGDGDDDLYLVSFAGPPGTTPDPAGANRLLRNDGESFVDVTDRSGVADLDGFGMGAGFADYDDDGDLDLYVTNRGPNRLFRNRGDGSFDEVGAAAGVDDSRWSIATAWGDCNRDGLLDLYVTSYVDFEVDDTVSTTTAGDPSWEGIPYTLNPNAFDPEPNLLYLQRPDGTFENRALELGVSNPGGRSLAATFVDLDQDGWLDLYVANDVSPNALFRNLGADLGDALFEDVSTSTGTADPRGSMGISVADLAVAPDTDPDGLPDLFVTHWIAQENALYQAVKTNGRLEYRDRVRHLRLAEISTDRVGWGSAFVDLDLDGRLDLVVANGSTLETDPESLQPQAPFLFWNDGERFYDIGASWGDDVARTYVARGLAVSDADRDGDPDLAVSINRGQPLLLDNTGPPRGHWLGVTLEGPTARRFGSRITRLDNDRIRDVRWYGADASFASGHSAEQLFGLGATTTADLIVAPMVGTTYRFDDLDANRRYRVRLSAKGDSP